jgi:uncharacterized protein YndB with AHSA1/START domain
MSDVEEPFRIELTIAAPVDEVWRWMRDPDLIRRWHGWEIEDGGLEAEIDHIYRQSFTGDEAAHTLSGKGDTFSLHDAGAGRTLVRLVRGAPSDNPEMAAYYDDVNEGWTTFLHQLRFAMERHPGADRRTVFVSGPKTDPLAALGLTEVATRAPGSRYTAEPAGEPAAGEVWFRSANQCGITVDGWGDGLLVAGPGMAVLTTYGLDDTAIKELRTRWEQWWQQASD